MRPALLKRKILNYGALGISYIQLFPWLFRLNKNSIIIDCGANRGHISSYLSLTGATIYAFEPDPIAFVQLVKRCSRRKNVNCINKGVWDKNAVIKLYRHREMKGQSDFTVSSSIIDEKKNIKPASAIGVEVIDLVEFMQSLSKKIDLIKIDIEGAEIQVLKKIIETRAYALFKTMYVETHETKIPGQKEELEKIKKELKRKEITNIKLNWI
jgi:FkbM family methyltransferase